MFPGKVFVTREIAAEAVDALRGAFAEVEVWQGEMPPPRALLLTRAQGCVALLTTPADRVDAPLLDASPGLRVVSNLAVGFDNFDVAEATRRGVALGNTPRVLSATTADLAFALLLAVARRVAELAGVVRQRQWRTWHPMQNLGYDVHHRVLGVVGMGQIGQEVARRAKGFDMEVVYFDTVRPPRLEELKDYRGAPDMASLLGQADFVSLHVPLTPQTRHLIGREQLRLMKCTAFLVNTSRGAVVDQTALYEALRDGTIAGAALDVTEPEPLPPDDPLLSLPNVVVTPHIGSATHETRRRMAMMAAENIIAAVGGRPMPSCVNPEVLRRRQRS